ncbi:hypothetical protein F4779DRAFT_618364 [Xylariaceae sp. FL0662B]|nr:hypothetical protein F4779DRAFT_618364 [Xylariaceae sp. FL0662B]
MVFRSRGYPGQMPVILEEDECPPEIPEKSPRRLTSVRYRGPECHSQDHPPPTRPRSEPPPNDQHPNRFVDRGVWYRLALSCLVAVGCIIAIIKGPVFGSHHGAQGGSDTESSLPLVRSPAGPYAFTVVLSNTSTACPSDPAIRCCYLHNAYDTPQTASSGACTCTIMATMVDQSVITGHMLEISKDAMMLAEDNVYKNAAGPVEDGIRGRLFTDANADANKPCSTYLGPVCETNAFESWERFQQH